jgi:hypothetical protein
MNKARVAQRRGGHRHVDEHISGSHVCYNFNRTTINRTYNCLFLQITSTIAVITNAGIVAFTMDTFGNEAFMFMLSI